MISAVPAGGDTARSAWLVRVQSVPRRAESVRVSKSESVRVSQSESVRPVRLGSPDGAASRLIAEREKAAVNNMGEREKHEGNLIRKQYGI